MKRESIHSDASGQSFGERLEEIIEAAHWKTQETREKETSQPVRLRRKESPAGS